MADSNAASCFCEFSFCGAETATVEEAALADRVGSEFLPDLGAGGLVIPFSTILAADAFFFSAISASRSGAPVNDKRLYQTGRLARNLGCSGARLAGAKADGPERHVIL